MNSLNPIPATMERFLGGGTRSGVPPALLALPLAADGSCAGFKATGGGTDGGNAGPLDGDPGTAAAEKIN